ncbi:hypothetical protein DID88_003534 [Monilinia fructigena]|uniref:Uncharacterized protein n=1 Tax=Monilinia fructigena TaxID=38457 RepID=A0A395IUS5_9HELO|nr:hypothetical protein DID88_003534 [Monilinia fructigena]
MVLENSSSKEGNESFDSIPASDNDPYASSEEGQGQTVGTQTYRIDSSKLPKPLPIFGPLFGYDETLLSKAQKTQGYNGASPTGGAEWSEEDDASVTAETTPQIFPTTKIWPQKTQTPAQIPVQEEKPFDLFDDVSPAQ